MSELAEIQRLHNNVQMLLQQAQSIIQRAVQDKTVSLDQASESLRQAEQNNQQLLAALQMAQGDQTLRFRREQKLQKQQIQQAKLKIVEIQNSDVLVSDVTNQAIIMNTQQMHQVRNDAQIQLLKEATAMAEVANDEIDQQDVKAGKIINRNDRVNNQLKKGGALADVIKCTEMKHLYLQSIGVSLSVAMTIAGIVCWIVLK